MSNGQFIPDAHYSCRIRCVYGNFTVDCFATLYYALIMNAFQEWYVMSVGHTLISTDHSYSHTQ